MLTVTLTYGLPASGKSTWAKDQVNLMGDRVVRVNMDDIRTMLGLPYSKNAEELALRIQDSAIVSAISSGKHVIVDNTHIEKKMPTRIKRLFDGDVVFQVQDFTRVPVQTCINRDLVRASQGRPAVGEEVIRRMAGRLSKTSWKLTEEWMNDVVLSPLYVPNPTKPLAIVYDLDGTVARHDHRSPYDYSRIHTDGLHSEIADIICKYATYDTYYAIALSGRPDINDHRKQTEDWLDRFGIPCDQLLMRPADMLNDNDADVKQFLFDKYIRDNFVVDFWLDDRDRVVRRMRKLGLRVLQVAEGNF
jgi:predicted kinase